MGAHDRLYATARWKKRRAAQLAEHPLCRFCLPAVVPATVADHVTPHRGDENAFWFGELQSLCASCHSSSKQQAEAGGRMRGCDVHGMPLDPAHPWNVGRRQGVEGGRNPQR